MNRCAVAAAVIAILGWPIPTFPAAPRWPADAAWYQIFPERFRNGDSSNDPTTAVVQDIA
ncbi:MAG: hypothetical protein EXS36_13810 [Pedosphaera sp.]|nr:hypothetical protein [Pedosphaera sp.]